MAVVLNSVEIQGFNNSEPGDAVAAVSLGGLIFQAGQTALWAFVDSVESLVAAQQNVDTTTVTKFETVSTQI